MQNELWKKGLIVGIIILFIGASVVSAFNIKPANESKSINRGWLYVGGSGPGNYSHILDAIDNASEGDTVFVYSGIYYENVVVNETINLLGEDKNITIIDGGNSGDVVYINENNVNISGFTIQNSGHILYVDFGIEIHSNHNSITNNIITNNTRGLFFYDSNNNIIYDNTITTNEYYYGICIWFYYSSNSTISGNTISNSYDGIALDYSNNNTISGNTVSNTLYGINLSTHSNNNIISGNTIISNYWGGSYLDESNNNTISGNTINSNTIGLCFYISNNNTISGNTISNNGLGIGIYYEYTSNNNNIIYHNNLINNSQNANDDGTNIWYNSLLQEGNYWSDYNGTDSNGDGIGDTPCNIGGGSNQDLYPFMYPNGWIPPSYVWVDDNFTYSTPGWGYDHFNHIQYGINAVSEHGMVYVFNGTYTEELEYLQYVRIRKSLSLIGENKETTIINCPGAESGVVIWAGVNHVNISGFTVKGYNLESIGIYGNHDNNDIIIENCIVHSFSDGISLVVGTNSQVRNCITYDNSRAGGIDIVGGNNHTIIDCTSYDNSYGIRIENSNSCIIYHNNLFNNTANAYDNGTNTWIDSYPSGGNYWSDYTGVDNNHGPNQSIPGPDGIGDTPYDFPCEHAIDRYPFMEPSGWLNEPPNKPTIDGPTSGKAGRLYAYTFNSTDPNGDNIYYFIDWGDNTTSGWLGPFTSGVDVTGGHKWNEQGTYIIKAKAKDNYGGESDWGTLSVTMPLDLQISQSKSNQQINQQSSNHIIFKMMQNVLLNIRCNT